MTIKKNLIQKSFFLGLIPLMLLALSACSGSFSTSGTDLDSESTLTVQVGTNGELISIQSDNVSAAGYDEASLVMTVQFRNGALYDYYQVPADLWISFIAAQPHPWSEVGYPRLVQGGVPYKRIG
jgi:hypothetical protein